MGSHRLSEFCDFSWAIFGWRSNRALLRGKKKVVGTELQTSDECHILFPRQVTGRVEQLLKVAAKALSFVQVINEPHACVTTVCRMSPNSHPVVLRSYLWF